jgi:hypothetical protein
VSVVWALAEVTDTDPLAMKPFASVTDLSAFKTFLAADGVTGLRVTFTYGDWTVTVTGDGGITLRETDGE